MPSLYANLAILEAADAPTLEEMLASGLHRYLVRRLGPAAIVVDHERLADVRKLLKRLGQTPRVTAE
jgi:hypothetical protein